MGWLAGCGELDVSPHISSVLAPPPVVYDPVGPYLIEAQVEAPMRVGRMLLRVTDLPHTGRFGELPFELVDGDLTDGRWQAWLPGAPVGSRYFFCIIVVDLDNKGTGYPGTDCDRSLAAFEIAAAP